MALIDIMREKLNKEFSPEILELSDDSHLHAGHAGHDGTGESHFSLTIRSGKLNDISRVKQHQLIYKCLSDEISSKIHALAIQVV